MTTKTIVIVSDLHSGSVYGLTPKRYISKARKGNMALEAFNAYEHMTKIWKCPDLLLANGDLVDGNQPKSGGAELLTCDRNAQADWAAELLEMWKAKRSIISYGTPYHTGAQAEDYEWIVADKLHAQIEGRLFFNIEGITFDARHKIGSSSIPHGRATPILREIAWNLIKEAEGCGVSVDVVIRSHVHYYIYLETGKKVALTTPALQLARGRYGSRECSGTTHWGAIGLTLDKGRIIGKDVMLWNLLANKPSVIKIK